ncbi:MAG: hypothetical protein ACP5EP_09715 [Acidobacteriaceae bacterium]
MKTRTRRSPRIEFRPMFRATELKGAGRKSSHLQVMVAFQQAAECTVERFVEAPNGWLLLASVPGRTNTGGIYLYDDRSKYIFWLEIAGRDEYFSASEFDNLLHATSEQPQARSTPARGTEKPVFVGHRRQRGGRNWNRAHDQHLQGPQGIVRLGVLPSAIMV